MSVRLQVEAPEARRRVACDVLVIGGGTAGTMAAVFLTRRLGLAT